MCHQTHVIESDLQSPASLISSLNLSFPLSDKAELEPKREVGLLPVTSSTMPTLYRASELRLIQGQQHGRFYVKIS